MREFEPVKFSEAYDLANVVWSYFFEWNMPEEFGALLNVRCEDLALRLVKPHKDSALHLFLRRFYTMNYIWEFERSRDDMLNLIIQEYEAVLQYNTIPYRRSELPLEQDVNYERLAKRRISYLRKKLPVDRIAQDTFQLLFRDRAFLLRFNDRLSQSVRSLASLRTSGLVTRNGTLRRARLPAWLRRGIFYRDNGRCVSCGSDLTGLMFNGPAVHYDHIVPLAAFGSNDPTNFQLLCSRCNLRKSTHPRTWERYPVFWGATPSKRAS